MNNDLSNLMYSEEPKEEVVKPQKKSNKLLKRLAVVTLLIGVASYLCILVIDINRYSRGLDPFITLSIEQKEYDDGYVRTAKSIGWVFREYQRETITTSEMAPSWSSIRKDNELNRKNDENFPDLELNYAIEENANKKEKIGEIIYFYKEDTLIGTYKCIHSKDCEATKSIVMPEDANQQEHRINSIEDRYIFITEYISKDTTAEQKIVYLIDLKAKRIIASYENIRHATIDDENKYNSPASTKGNYYIGQTNGKYGIFKVEKGKVSIVLDPTYEFIEYNANAKVYVLKTIEEETTYYSLYNLEENRTTSPIVTTIKEIYEVNQKYYILSSKKENFEVEYTLFDEEGHITIQDTQVDNLEVYETFIIYAKDLELYIKDYDGNNLIENPIQLYYTYSKSNSVKSYSVTITGTSCIIKTPHENRTTHLTEEYYYNKDTFELTKKRENVSETN